MAPTKGRRHLGYIIVPIVDDDDKTPILPDLRRAWGLPRNNEDYLYPEVWTSRAAASKARRTIFGNDYKKMRVCRIRLGE